MNFAVEVAGVGKNAAQKHEDAPASTNDENASSLKAKANAAAGRCQDMDVNRAECPTYSIRRYVLPVVSGER